MRLKEVILGKHQLEIELTGIDKRKITVIDN